MEIMCKIDWIIILEYLKVIIWPLLIIIIIVFNKKVLGDFLERIVYKSNQLGLGPVSVEFDKKELEVIIEKSKDKDDITKNVNEYVNYHAFNKAVGLAEEFRISKRQDRDRITNEISELIRSIDVEYIYSHSQLENFEYQLVLLIAILREIEVKKVFDIIEKKNIKDFIGKSLKDESSFIRFKASRIFYLSEELSVEFMESIKSALKNEKNLAVQRILKLITVFYS